MAGDPGTAVSSFVVEQNFQLIVTGAAYGRARLHL
jgi:hypothetical protein